MFCLCLHGGMVNKAILHSRGKVIRTICTVQSSRPTLCCPSCFLEHIYHQSQPYVCNIDKPSLTKAPKPTTMRGNHNSPCQKLEKDTRKRGAQKHDNEKDVFFNRNGTDMGCGPTLRVPYSDSVRQYLAGMVPDRACKDPRHILRPPCGRCRWINLDTLRKSSQ